MAAALRSPTSYSGLCPVDNTPIDAALKSDFATYIQAMREIEDQKIGKQSEADRILAKYESDVTIRQFLLTNFVRTTPTRGDPTPTPAYHFRIPLKTLSSNMNGMGDFPFRDPDETRFQGPTLVVRGTKSHYVADEALPLVGRFFPQFELVSLDCGHWVMAERFEDFRTAFVEWCERCVEKK